MRWRDVKQGKITPKNKAKCIINSASMITRFKAFVIDTFMIYIPILYITTYGFLNGKEDFLSNQLAVFIDTFLFGLILSMFFSKTGQSPGFKAYELKLIDNATGNKPTFLKAFIRYFYFLISGTTIVGLFMGFFRKDKKTLHDILSNTKVQNV